MRLLRNLARRRLRTTLTITGITIGIWALVVFSSMANKVDALVSGGSDYYAGKIVVSDGGFGGIGGQPMPIDQLAEIAAIDGIDLVVPTVAMIASDIQGVSFGPPDQIQAFPFGADQGRETYVPQLAQGRSLSAEDEGRDVAVLGTSIAAKRGVGVGDTIVLHERTFEVVGVLEPTLSTPDTTIVVPFTIGQQLVHEDLPAVIRDGVAADQLATAFIVYPAANADDATVAAAIEHRFPGVKALTGDAYDASVGSSVGVFNSIIVGIGLVSLIVGGLSVINTMAMSVAERTREIGVKRAIGATRRRIIRELMVEAGVIGAIGGLLGVALGALVVVLVNEAGRSSGTVLFELTTGTALFAFAFSTVLGVVAGIIPAWSAARLDPVAALRYE
ncbi:MAG TPA: ABC transporter permease [Candidatus Limnocylindrales bacterium]|nr:ABC transporter permease [Candidatus Limnocylindrales bacterium]